MRLNVNIFMNIDYNDLEDDTDNMSIEIVTEMFVKILIGKCLLNL